MGIADRDYYRDDGRWHNPFARAQISVLLAVMYLLMFIAQTSMQAPMGAKVPGDNARDLTGTLLLNSNDVFAGEIWRVISYSVILQPGNLLHLLFTCFFILWIGRQIEDLYGNKEYFAYYLATSILGGLAFVVSAAIGVNTNNLIGPSAAVTALFVLYALHYPGTTINVFYIVPVPIWAIVVLYGAADVLALHSSPASAPLVAVHLAGAGFAYIYHRYSLRVLNLIPHASSSSFGGNRSKTKLRIFQEQSEKVPEPATAGVAFSSAAPSPMMAPSLDEHFEAKLDEVLEKVNKFGRASLTPTEQEVLLRASAIFKKRRQSN